MDKSWMNISDRRQSVYVNGVNSFLDFAFTHSARGNNIRCPCYKCGNNNFHTREIVFVHLILNGIIKTYRWWSCHGEDYYSSPTSGSDDDVCREGEEEILEHDDMPHDVNTSFNDMNEIGHERNHEASRKFYDVLDDAEQELYPGCKEFSKFQFMVILLALKSDHRWTDRSFTELLKVLKRAIPCSEKLPSTFYEANNYIQRLEMKCKKTDPCLNDCILYRGADFESCSTCGMSMWQSSKINNNAENNMLSRKSTNLGANSKSSRIKSLTSNSPLHSTSARQYLLDWETNSSTLHPRSTVGRIRSLARSFTQRDYEPSQKHQAKESQKPISLHLDRGLKNENPHAYVESVVEHVSIELEADHVPANPTNFEHDINNGAESVVERASIEVEADHVLANSTNLEHDINNGLIVTKKRTRGPTIGLERSKRRQNNMERVDVQLPAELRRLVGYRAQELITKSGRYVRQHAPLNVDKWSEIPTDIIDKLINIIYTEFNLPNESHVRGDLISSLRRHYNVWRFHLHVDHYLKWNTDAQRRANCPKYIDPAQWNWIISYWGSDRFKKISEINKQNRSQQKMKSRVGSKSIARTIYEMREAPQESDELPIYVRLWEKTRKGKHNEWQDETAEELYKKLLELHHTQIRENGEDKLTPEEAYTIVLGHRPGYVLGMRLGPERVRTNVQQLQANIQAELEVKMTNQFQEVEDRMTQRIEAKMLALLKQKKSEDQVDNTN